MPTGAKSLTVSKVDDWVKEIADLHTKALSQAMGSRECAGKAIAYAIECGKRLCQQKERLRHGYFEKWVHTNAETLGFRLRTARNYMQLANRQALADLPKEQAETMRVRDAYRSLGIMPAKPKLGERINASGATKVIVRVNTPVRLANDLRLAIVRERNRGRSVEELGYLRGLYGELKKIFG